MSIEHSERILSDKSILSQKVRFEIDTWIKKFPAGREKSALLAALRIVQHENKGFLTQALMDGVADYFALSPIEVYEVASFYSMFEIKPVGKHSISLCTNISCMLRGADVLRNHLEEKLGIKTGESTADGKFYLKEEEECLAACCGAPMCMIDHVYYEDLTIDKLDKILEDLP